MTEVIRVLIVEDSVNDTFLVVRELQLGGYQVVFERVETASLMREALDRERWDLIISDYVLPQFTGAAALATYQQWGLDIPFIIVSGMIGEEIAVDMLKAGAHYYVMKGNLDRLVPAVQQELKAAKERQNRRQIEQRSAFLASLVSSCDDAITGETLEGKIVSWNTGAERLYGYTATEMLGQSVSRLIPHYRPEELTDILARIGRGERIERFETVRLRKDGSPVEVALTISPIKDGAGRVVGASAVGRDITHWRQQENERLALIQDLTAALARANNETEQPQPRPS
jgi:PAS domain S-box-containing protein